MKKTLYTLAAAVAVMTAATGCDTVSEDNRYLELPEVEASCAVLIEDFTGQMCTNCPAAHLMIEQLQEQYGDQFIPVSIHAGKQSISIDDTFYPGLATPAGEVYDGYFGIGRVGYPAVVVNGLGANVYLGTEPAWVSAVREALTLDAVMDIALDVKYDDATSQISINSTISPLADFKGKLQLWIIENGVVAMQMGVGGNPRPDMNYVHNNVFRAAVNGDWGEEVDLKANIFHYSENSYTIASEWEKTWNVDNLYIVAFVYDDGSGVVQACRAKVTPQAAPEE